MLDKLIDLAIEEDIGSGDITTDAIIPKDLEGKGEIKAKQELILSGLKPAEKIFSRVDSSLKWEAHAKDGDRLKKGDLIAEVSGPVASILKGERTALNFLQHLSGVATFTYVAVQEIGKTKTRILDTRKTLPAYRELEKEAVRCGGGVNHRMGLYDRYLIKDNHIEAAGSFTDAIEKAIRHRKDKTPIEVEVRDPLQAEEAASLGVDIIMLDNFSPGQVKDAVELVAGRSKIEVSGNIDLKNVSEFVMPGVDFISMGAITHSAPAVDIHMIISTDL